MSEALDFGRYAPFIWSAYGASFVVIAILIITRWRALLTAQRRDKENAGQAKAGS